MPRATSNTPSASHATPAPTGADSLGPSHPTIRNTNVTEAAALLKLDRAEEAPRVAQRGADAAISGWGKRSQRYGAQRRYIGAARLTQGEIERGFRAMERAYDLSAAHLPPHHADGAMIAEEITDWCAKTGDAEAAAVWAVRARAGRPDE